ncbi:MAG: hypothetical protein U1F27_02235 [Turneriella sp.]
MPVPKYLVVIFLVLTIIAFAGWLFYSVQIHRAKPGDLAWRGIVKMVALNGTPQAISNLYSRWFWAFWSFFILTCITVALAVWATDHSFLIVIFPLLFYYFFVRYFMWEKADLAD